MSVNDYAEQVVNNFITDITDHLFLSIERDDSLMQNYKTNINIYGQENVNQTIGKKVKELLNLGNSNENDKPKSQLIKSYTRHKRN
jgi:hypothetical protein